MQIVFHVIFTSEFENTLHRSCKQLVSVHPTLEIKINDDRDSADRERTLLPIGKYLVEDRILKILAM